MGQGPRPWLLQAVLLSICFASVGAAQEDETVGPRTVRLRPTPLSFARTRGYRAEERFVRDLYARLMRYQFAGAQLDDGQTGSPGALLSVVLTNLRTFEGPPPVGPVAAGKTLKLTKLTRCHAKDPCHVAYAVAWDRQADATRTTPGATTRVKRYTRYLVTLDYRGGQRRYEAVVAFHEAADGVVVPEVLDPTIPALSELVDLRAPQLRPRWEEYVRSSRYAMIARAVRTPGDRQPATVQTRPIGMLLGDDVATSSLEPNSVSSYPVPCGEGAQRPTYVSIIGTPAYTVGPPAPYVYNVSRQILDQNRNPIDRRMFVDESWSPSVPDGNCTALPVDEGDAYSNDYGMFGPDLYSLSGGAPAGCESVSTQSFRVSMAGTWYSITTRYRVTWRQSGVTVACIAGCTP
jgi:hypothetical protein